MAVVEQLLNSCRQVPFKPFTIVMEGGARHVVRGPTEIRFNPTRPGVVGVHRGRGSWILFGLGDVVGVIPDGGERG